MASRQHNVEAAASHGSSRCRASSQSPCELLWFCFFFFSQEWCTNPPGPGGVKRVHRSFYEVFSPCTHIECLWARAQSKSKFPCVFITVLKQVCIFFSTWRVGFMLNLLPPQKDPTSSISFLFSYYIYKQGSLAYEKKNLEFSSFTVTPLKSALNVAYKNRTHWKTTMKSSFRLNQLFS